MEYEPWRKEVFGAPEGSDPIWMELPEWVDGSATDETLDFIDRALVDPDIHSLFSREQIGAGLQLIYCNACSDLPHGYLKAGDEARRTKAVENLRFLYRNFFERYCHRRIELVGDEGGCKSLSVNWSLSISSSSPFRGRRSEGERSEPNADAPGRGCSARFASLVAGHAGLLVEVYQNTSTQIPHDPPERL